MTDFERQVLGEVLDKLNPNNNAVPAPDFYKAYEEATTLRETTVKTSAGETRIDIIEAKDRKKPSAVMFNLYGAGFTNPHFIGNTWYCRRIAAECHIMVIDVYYTRAQVAGYPTQWNEVYDLLKWANDNADELGIDKDKIMICGDSSGCQISCGVTMMAKKNGYKDFNLALSILIYGGYDSAGDPNLREGAEQSSRARIRMTMMFDTPAIAALPEVSPIRGTEEDFKGMNDLYMICGRADFLYPENRDLAAKIVAAGVNVNWHTYDGCPHGFICRWKDAYNEAITDIEHAITAKLAAIDLAKK